jgi:ABC-type phosphate transport system substrate-binding protein
MNSLNRKFSALALVAGLVLTLPAEPASAEVVAVVSAKSPVTALSENQIVDIFLGKLNRLANGQPVVAIDQTEGSSVRDEFYQKFAGKSPAQIKAHWSKIIFTGRGHPPKDVSDSAEVKKQLAANPNAIGYIDPKAVDESVRVLQSE